MINYCIKVTKDQYLGAFPPRLKKERTMVMHFVDTIPNERQCELALALHITRHPMDFYSRELDRQIVRAMRVDEIVQEIKRVKGPDVVVTADAVEQYVLEQYKLEQASRHHHPTSYQPA